MYCVYLNLSIKQDDKQTAWKKMLNMLFTVWDRAGSQKQKVKQHFLCFLSEEKYNSICIIGMMSEKKKK